MSPATRIEPVSSPAMRATARVVPPATRAAEVQEVDPVVFLEAPGPRAAGRVFPPVLRAAGRVAGREPRAREAGEAGRDVARLPQQRTLEQRAREERRGAMALEEVGEAKVGRRKCLVWGCGAGAQAVRGRDGWARQEQHCRHVRGGDGAEGR